MVSILDKHNVAIQHLCVSHKVKTLYAFGSVLTDNFTGKSDIDLIVDFESIAAENYAENYFDLKFSLQDMLNRKIDLLEEKAIKNPYFKQAINETRQLVYGY